LILFWGNTWRDKISNQKRIGLEGTIKAYAGCSRIIVAQITVRFVSQIISVTRDKTGSVIDGDPEKVTDVTDIWTFAPNLPSRDPNWELVATEAG
jgi:hypothetical protein